MIEHLSFERAIDEYVGLRCVRDGHFFRGILGIFLFEKVRWN